MRGRSLGGLKIGKNAMGIEYNALIKNQAWLGSKSGFFLVFLECEGSTPNFFAIGFFSSELRCMGRKFVL